MHKTYFTCTVQPEINVIPAIYSNNFLYSNLFLLFIQLLIFVMNSSGNKCFNLLYLSSISLLEKFCCIVCYTAFAIFVMQQTIHTYNTGHCRFKNTTFHDRFHSFLIIRLYSYRSHGLWNNDILAVSNIIANEVSGQIAQFFIGK